MDEKQGCYRKYIGQDTEVYLSEEIDGVVLETIGSKAFLSCKTVERLVLPASVAWVEDWAFAHMKQLREIVLPVREISFGKQVFLGCDKLERVTLYEIDRETKVGELQYIKERNGLDRLRASMFRYFPIEVLEHLENMTDEGGQKQWLGEYDEALETFLRKPDDTGFEPAFIGWFDVEDVDDQRQKYIVNRRRDKVELAFQRFVCGEMPRESFQEYLYHVIVEQGELVKELFMTNPQYGCSIEYFKIWQQSGGLERNIAQALLTELPWEEPEIRGYLMERLQSDGMNYFMQLEL